MVTKITKMIPRIYYVVDDVEFSANDLFRTLEIILDGNPEDLDYCLLYNTAESLFKLGYLVKKFGYHESIVFRDTEDKKAEKLFEEILKL